MRRHSLRRPSRSIAVLRDGAVAVCIALSSAVVLPALARADAIERGVSYLDVGGAPAFGQR